MAMKPKKNAVVFFIGGAGDKEPMIGKATKIMFDCKIYFDKDLKKRFSSYHSVYLGYKDVFETKNIEKYVISELNDSSVVYIVGHSLGGWNGAHLSKILSEKGYKVDLLVTTDPVGVNISWVNGAYKLLPAGTLSYLTHEFLQTQPTFDIYFRTPEPKANLWVNIYSPALENIADGIAVAGGQFVPDQQADIHIISSYSHGDADKMFREQISGQKSAYEILIECLKKMFQNE